MADAGADERDEPIEVTAAAGRRRQAAARPERPGLRLVPGRDADAAPAAGQSGEQARLLGAYNTYNG